MNENELAAIIVDAALDVHATFGGPGLLENVCVAEIESLVFAPWSLCVFALIISALMGRPSGRVGPQTGAA
jgi:hypothetical protein